MSSKRRARHRDTVPQRARRYTSPIFAGKYLGESRELDLKAESRSVIEYVLQCAPIKRIRLLGVLFPKTLNELAGPIPIAPSDELVTQLNWLCAVLCHHADPLNHFLHGLDHFQRSLLVGDYDDADTRRKEIVESHGQSWWATEAELLAAQRRGGLGGNREALGRYTNEGTKDWIRFACHLISLKLEDGFQAEDYDRQCSLLTAATYEEKETRRPGAYLSFRHNFHNFRDPTLLPYCLSVEESHSLIDRYCSFLRALQFALAQGEAALGKRVAGIAASAARAIRDPRLSSIASVLQPETLEDRACSEVLFSALDSYTAGSYQEAAREATRGLNQYPGIFEFYELSVHSRIRAGLPSNSPFSEDSIASEILRVISDVLSRNESMPDSMRRLIKLSYQLDCLPIGSQLYSFFRTHDSKPGEIANTFARYSTGVVTPRLSIFVPNSESSLKYLERLGQLHPTSLAVRLFRDVQLSIVASEDLIAVEGLPETRLWKYRSFVFEQSRQHDFALQAFQRLDALSEGDLLLKSEATTGLYRSYLRLDRVLDSASILARAAAVTPRLVAESTIREVLSKYPSRHDSEWLGDICWPVLHISAHKGGYAKYDLDQLHDVLDEFLSARGINRPTELRSIEASLPKSCLVVLLAALCTPDVLQSSVWYRSQEEVERERIEVCKWLVELDPTHAAEYLREIAELTSRSTIREIAHPGGQSKIFVDTDGVKDSLSQAFIDRAERFLGFAELKSTLRGTIEAANFTDVRFKEVSIVIIDGAVIQFTQLFNEVRHLFLYSNEYGLDSNLSQRIRHGTLLGAIRAPFEQANLVTLKNSDGVYLDNTHWVVRLAEPDDPSTEIIRSALQDLSRDIDTIAHEVRTQWIQIKGPTNNFLGMFDYEFTQEALQDLYEGMGNLASAEALVDLVLDVLWKRTEEDLQAVRSAITGGLKQRLCSTLDCCQTSLEAVVSSEKVVEFRSASTSCKTSLEYALDSISDWFRVDRANRMPSFPLTSLIDAVLDNVDRYCRPSHLLVSQRIKVAHPVQGRLFRPMWDVFFILCDNIAKHSQLENASVELNVAEDAGRIAVEVVNDLDENVNLPELKRKLSTTPGREMDQNEWDLLRREGGTGLTKIHKIIRFELRVDTYDFEIGVRDDNRFFVSLAFQAKGMFDESPSG